MGIKFPKPRYRRAARYKKKPAWQKEKELRARLKRVLQAQSGGYCGYCGKRKKKLTLDHIVPVSKGGVTRLNNLVLCCFTCNQIKADRTVEQWLAYLEMVHGNEVYGDIVVTEYKFLEE